MSILDDLINNYYYCECVLFKILLCPLFDSYKILVFACIQGSYQIDRLSVISYHVIFSCSLDPYKAHEI